MAKAPHFTPEDHSEAEDAVAVLIGQITISWNFIHENLAAIFSRLAGFADRQIGLRVWHSLPSDAQQRGLLSAALKGMDQSDTRVAELTEVLKLLNSRLRGFRNDVIHAPYGFVIEDEALSLGVIFHTFNPQGMNIRNRGDIVPSFTAFRDRLDELGALVLKMRLALDVPEQFAWPAKPAP